MGSTPNKLIDYTNKDYYGFNQNMLNSLAKELPEYTDLSETDAGVVILELLAKGLDVLSFYQDVYANEAYLTTAQQRENVLKWCRIFGYTPRSAIPAQYKQVFVLSEPQEEDVVIPRGTLVSTPSTNLEESIYFETLQDLTIPAGKHGDEVDEHGDYVYSVTVEQGTSVQNDFIGTSSGAPNQRFKLKYPSVIPSSLSLYVNEGSGYVLWDRVDNFLDSNSQSLHYYVESDEYDNAYVVFGDGVTGRIPSYTMNAILVDYRIGGGGIGNVSADKICVMHSAISAVESTFNPSSEPIVTGQDKETVESIKKNALTQANTMYRAVERSDYENLVTQNFSALVKSSSAEYAGYQGDGTEDLINLYFYPYTVDTAVKIEDFFEERVIVGTKMSAVEPVYKQVSFNMSMGLDAGVDRGSVVDDIAKRVAEFMDNLGVGKNLEFYALEKYIVDGVEGVRYVRVTQCSSGTSDAVPALVKEKIIISDITINPDVTTTIDFVADAESIFQEQYPDLYAIYSTLV
jgi:hypothetical protein